MTIELAGERGVRRIMVGPGFDRELLREVIAALEAPAHREAES
jgi:hypothetical protein